MISTENVSLSFGGRKLFDEVNIKFTPGNCYGLIGANGAGKSTFLKILSKEIDAQTGVVNLAKGLRLSVLKQDHFAFDQHKVLETVIMGNERLYQIMKEKETLYAKEDFSDEDGLKASQLEEEFGELNGWEAESEAGVILSGLGVSQELFDKNMKDLAGEEKVKVLLAQAVFGQPDVLLLDEPTNHLDIKAICWLEEFLLNFPKTVVVVSHDRHFLNKVCTHIADIDYGKITSYSGNYEFWRKSSELAVKLKGNYNKKQEEKIKELKSFIQRFSANASKSKQATSRQKQLEKITLEELPVSGRKYPYVNFEQKREAGKDILSIQKISKKVDGEELLKDISFSLDKGDKVILLGDDDLAKTTLLEILAGTLAPDTGEVNWGITITKAYFPKDNADHFSEGSHNLVDWLREYSEEKDESFLRGFLGRMLFSGEEALKKTNVLSGGERVRCMLAKMMMIGGNVLLLDGPTNHLDLESITAVNDALKRFKGTVIFTSHDHEFIQTVANRVIEIEDGKIKDDQRTSFDNYIGYLP